MLKLLRKKGVAKKLLWVIAIVIIISFGLFGRANYLSRRNISSYAGKIFGERISFNTFENIYKQVYIQSLLQYGDKFYEIREYLDLNAKTWDRLILLHEAKKRRIKVTNQEIISAIEDYAIFQKNGQFDTLLYNNILRYIRVRPRDFEESVRETLKIAKLYNQVTSDLTIDEDIIWDAYKNKNEKVQVSYVFVSPDKFVNQVSLEESESKEYFEKNKNNFLIPPSISVYYISLDLPEVQKKEDDETNNSTSEEELQEQIEEKRNSIINDAYSMYQDLLSDPNMDAIAKNYGVEAKSSGFFNMNKPDLSPGWSYDFLKKLFELKVNEITEPFETSNKVFIAKLKERKASYIPEYDEIKNKVTEILSIKKARSIAKDKANEYLEALKEELNKTKLKDFSKAAKILGLEIFQTPLFNRGTYLPKIGISKNFQETAFLIKDSNELSNVVETEKGYCILNADSYVPANKENYEKEKEKFSETILNEYKGKIFNDFLTSLRLKAKLEDKISELKNQQDQ